MSQPQLPQCFDIRRREDLWLKIVDRVEICRVTKCWNYGGADSGDGRGGGYGRMYYQGQTIAVHLAMFTLVHGYLHRWQQVDHICCNRACVNPDHLKAVTHKQNQKLRAQRARKIN